METDPLIAKSPARGLKGNSGKPESGLEQIDEEEKDQTDEVGQVTGNFGIWQFWICLSVSMVKWVDAWHHLAIIFLAPVTEFQCAEGDYITSADQCFVINNGTYEACHKWEFDTSIFKQTIISEFGLVCDKNQLPNVVQSASMLGGLVGSMLFGVAADRYGRKKPLIIGVVGQLVAGVAAAFMPTYELLLLFRFITSVAVGGTMAVSCVLCMEVVGGKWRTIVGTLYHIPFNFGHMTLPVIAYFTRSSWRIFEIAISLPSALLLSYCWLTPESPRWLVATGRGEKALPILDQAVRANEREFPADLRESIRRSPAIVKKKPSIFDLYKTPNLRIRIIAAHVNWIICGLIYYGLAQYMGRIGGNIFINVSLSGIIELPGGIFCMYLMDTFGRKKTMVASKLLIAASMLLITQCSSEDENATERIILAFFGVVGISTAFPTLHLFTGELFPTVLRNVAIGSGVMFSLLGSMVSPFVLSLDEYGAYLPPLVFGLCPLVSAASCMLLPETLGSELLHTLEDCENFGKNSDNMKQGKVNSSFVGDESSTDKP
nr:PREDICTED: organic cation transporter protein-like isoform X1 [Bemisia tabaci]